MIQASDRPIAPSRRAISDQTEGSDDGNGRAGGATLGRSGVVDIADDRCVDGTVAVDENVSDSGCTSVGGAVCWGDRSIGVDRGGGLGFDSGISGI